VVRFLVFNFQSLAIMAIRAISLCSFVSFVVKFMLFSASSVPLRFKGFGFPDLCLSVFISGKAISPISVHPRKSAVKFLPSA
jgi:hypothetical protein